MKKTKFIHKTVSLLLLLAMLAGDFLAPAARSVRASDGTGSAAAPSETEPAAEPTKEEEQRESESNIRQQTVWYWHKGLPPLDGKEYPVLLCWEDKYYWTIDSSVLNYLGRRSDDNYFPVSDGFSLVGFTNGWLNTKKNEGSPSGQYHVQVGYPIGPDSSNRLSDLDFDYSVLKSTGSAVSFKLPELPVMKRLPKEEIDPLTGLTQDDLADRVMIGIRPDQEMIDQSRMNFFAAGETNWLAGFRYINYEVHTTDYGLFTMDSSQTRDFRWYLFPINSMTYSKLTQLMYGSHPDLKTGATSVEDFMTKNENNMVWYVSDFDGQTIFTERGFRHQHGRISESFDDYSKLNQLVSRRQPDIALGHNAVNFATYGNRNVSTYNMVHMWMACDAQTRSKFGFDVYYAEPNLMYFLKTDIDVEDGQTQNLDGPLVIEEGVKIRVKDGGVLSLTDWVVHQGEILIEPGGTMILQQNTTANGYTRNSAVISNNKNATSAGRIACDGNIIIMPNCTLAAGGIYGLQLGEGAQVVNYGQIVAELWDIYNDYTVEGRDGNSHSYIGYSMSDTGFGLVPEGFHRISDLGCLSAYQKGSFVGPNSWLYGKQTAYTINHSAKVEYLGNRRGRVTPQQ